MNRPNRLYAASLLCLALLSVGASAEPFPGRLRGHPGNGGGGGGGGATAHAGDCAVDPVCADFASGQTFIQWKDPNTGSAGANKRFRVVRSTSSITNLNYGSATVIARYALNNSGQLFGGSPDAGSAWSMASIPYPTGSIRQDGAQPMSKIPDALNGGTKTLSAFTGLQIYTAIGSANAYYAVIETDTSDGSDNYVGSVGPVAESGATPQPVKYAASGSRVDNTYGTLTSTSGGCLVASCPVVFTAHQSSSTGGPAGLGNSKYGDYWEWWLTTAEGWQDGRATAWNVHQDNAAHYPSLAHSLEVANRDTFWNPSGTGGLESNHFALGLTPLSGSANRLYPVTTNSISRMLNWTLSNYGADANQLHWVGGSMGAWGGAHTAMHSTSPKFSAVWIQHPAMRFDRRGCGNWPGSTWASTYPFKATTAAAACTLGQPTTGYPSASWNTTASAVLMGDGTRWGGDGGYADLASFVTASPGTDLPVLVWVISKDDPFPISFLEQIETATALKQAKRGFAFCWFMGVHDTTFTAAGAIDKDFTGHDDAIAYGKADFKLNTPYPAFSNSSIDDNPGTGVRQANGLYDGDPTGCMNMGFRWNFTSDTSGGVNFTVSNNAMGRNATVVPSTTITGSIASSGSGSVTVLDGTFGGLLKGTGGNPYFQIGNEVVVVSSVVGNTVNFTTRGFLGSAAQAHSATETIRQFVTQATGPNIGAQTSMTVDITPRRLQGFLPANGATVTCNITPNGGSLTTQTPTVANGLFTLTGVTINASGVTVIECS